MFLVMFLFMSWEFYLKRILLNLSNTSGTVVGIENTAERKKRFKENLDFHNTFNIPKEHGWLSLYSFAIVLESTESFK